MSNLSIVEGCITPACKGTPVRFWEAPDDEVVPLCTGHHRFVAQTLHEIEQLVPTTNGRS